MTRRIDIQYAIPAVIGACIGCFGAIYKSMGAKSDISADVVRPMIDKIDMFFYNYPIEALVITTVASAIITAVGVYGVSRIEDAFNIPDANKQKLTEAAKE